MKENGTAGPSGAAGSREPRAGDAKGENDCKYPPAPRWGRADVTKPRLPLATSSSTATCAASTHRRKHPREDAPAGPCCASHPTDSTRPRGALSYTCPTPQAAAEPTRTPWIKPEAAPPAFPISFGGFGLLSHPAALARQLPASPAPTQRLGLSPSPFFSCSWGIWPRCARARRACLGKALGVSLCLLYLASRDKRKVARCLRSSRKAARGRIGGLRARGALGGAPGGCVLRAALAPPGRYCLVARGSLLIEPSGFVGRAK